MKSYNVEKNEKENNYPRKYNRYVKKEEEPKSDAYQKEVVIKEEKRVRPKRFGYSKVEENPQIIETKTEIIETRGNNGDNRPGQISTTTKEISINIKKKSVENRKRNILFSINSLI